MNKNIKSLMYPIVFVFILPALLVYFLFRMFDPGPAPSPVYKNGELVVSVLNGQRGQIAEVYCFRGTKSCLYGVRFVGASLSTTPHLIGSGGPIGQSPFELVEMRDFEIKPIGGE